MPPYGYSDAMGEVKRDGVDLNWGVEYRPRKRRKDRKKEWFCVTGPIEPSKTSPKVIREKRISVRTVSGGAFETNRSRH